MLAGLDELEVFTLKRSQSQRPSACFPILLCWQNTRQRQCREDVFFFLFKQCQPRAKEGWGLSWQWRMAVCGGGTRDQRVGITPRWTCKRSQFAEDIPHLGCVQEPPGPCKESPGPVLFQLFTQLVATQLLRAFSFLNRLPLVLLLGTLFLSASPSFLSFYFFFIEKVRLVYFTWYAWDFYLNVVICALYACLESLEVRGECGVQSRCRASWVSLWWQTLNQGHLKEQSVFSALDYPAFFSFFKKRHGFIM